MRTLYFEKLSQYDRVAEPVTVSIPFGQGKLPDADHFVIDDDGEAIPSQQRALAHWPDGSVKWLLVHLQPDLPGNLAKTLNFRVASGPGERPAAAAGSGHGRGGRPAGRHRATAFSGAARRLSSRAGCRPCR